nr:unnamed protein product [Digitaria exilis]
MSLMGVASPPFPFPSSSSSPHHLRRVATATAAAVSSASEDFDYPLADPSVRWPHLRFPHLPAPRFPATVTAAPPAPTTRPPQVEEDDEPGETSALVEPLDARAHRGRVKKLSKLALRLARDWRARVAGLTDAVLALPPGALVDDVLESARAAPDEVALVVRTVGETSWRRALDVFEWLARSSAPAPRAVAVVLGVLGRARQDAVAEELFLRFAGEGATVQVFNAMMGVYARSGRFEEARQLLDTMHDRGIEPDLVSFNTLINARAKSGCLPAGVALDLLSEVRQAGLRPDVITYNTLISACSQSSNLEDAVTVFEEMLASECRPDLWTYNSMVTVHGRCGKAKEAEQLFRELVEKGFTPDAVTYNSLLYAFAKEGDVEKVEHTCEDLVKAGFKKNEITYNTMIHMYGKMGRLDLAVSLYDEMRAMGCTPDTVTYTVLIDSLGKMDRIAEAGKLLEEMAGAGLKPTLVTFSALICAYAKGGRRAEAEKTFDSMVASGVKPDRFAYLVMLDVFARSGETKKMLNLYRTMMKDSYRLDDGMYQALLAALAKEDKYEEIEEVIQDMELLCQMSPRVISTILIKARDVELMIAEMEEVGFKPDVAILNALLMMYTATGNFDRTIQDCGFDLPISVVEKDWGADFRKMSAGAALVGLTLWLDHMQDASLQGSPESPKSVVLVTGEGEYNMVSLHKTIRAYLLEMGSPFLPCRARSGRFVAKAYSLKMWLKDSPFCMDLELKDIPALPKLNSMKLIDGYFMRAGLVPAFKDIHERLGEVWPKKFSRLALLSEESRDEVIKAEIQGKKEKLERMKKGLVTARKSKRKPRRTKFVREQEQGMKAVSK